MRAMHIQGFIDVFMQKMTISRHQHRVPSMIPCATMKACPYECGNDSMRRTSLHRPRLSPRTLETEHVVQSYGRSKLGEISAEKALFTANLPNFDQP